LLFRHLPSKHFTSAAAAAALLFHHLNNAFLPPIIAYAVTTMIGFHIISEKQE